MTLRFRETPDRIIVYLADSEILDDSRIHEERVGTICQRAKDSARKLIISFRGMEYMSSAMIGMLVILINRAKQESLDLRLSNTGRDVLDVINVMGLNMGFQIDEDDDDDPGWSGSPAPLPKAPSILDGRAEPPSS